MKEFKVNDYITLKLEFGNTNIYVNQEFFNQCKFLLLEIPLNETLRFDEISSIDEAAEILDHSMEEEGRDYFNIPPETEFWGHCSNLQAWSENNYDTNLLHSNLSFPLLKKLTFVGDPIAKQVFKEEIAIRLRSKSISVIYYLLEEKYLDVFNRDELEIIFDDSLFLKASKQEKLLSYLVTTYLKFRLWDLIIKGLLNILKDDPKNAIVWYYLGSIHLNKSNCIIKTFNKFAPIKKKQDFSSVYSFNEYNQNLDKALEAYKKSLEMNSQLRNTWNDLFKIYKLRKDFNKTIKAYKQMLEIFPNDKNIPYYLITFYRYIKKIRKFNLIKIIQNINSKEKLILFDYICPQCGKITKTDFKKIKLCEYCNSRLSKSGKYEKFNLRKPAFAGTFYPKDKEGLIKVIEDCFKNDKHGPGKNPNPLNTPRTVIGGISPEASYIFSGYASAHTFLNLFQDKIPETVIILGSGVTNYDKVGIMAGGVWETPIGNVTIDSELSLNIAENCQNIIIDDSSFLEGILKQYRSIEVQLPFIKYCSKGVDTKIVPIIIYSNIYYEVLNELSFGIANAIRQSNKDVVCLAVGVMSHQPIRNIEELYKFKKLDQNVIKSFEKFAPKRSYLNLLEIQGSGLETFTLLMLICKKLGAVQCISLKYYTSDEIFGKTTYIGAYFSGIILKEKRSL